MKIRKGTFETNSSSTHSIAISKNKVNIPVGSSINFHIGEYGWEEGKYSFPDYMYTSLLYNDDEEGLQELISILNKWKVKYNFEKPKWEYYDGHRYLQNGYIDHSGKTFSIMRTIIDDEDLLARALFGNATVYTGNDNTDCDNPMYYCAIEKTFDWETDKYIDNQNHDSEHYDYFFKGN